MYAALSSTSDTQWARLYLACRDLEQRISASDPRRPTVVTLLSVLRAYDNARSAKSPVAVSLWDTVERLSVRLCGQWNN